MKSLRLLAVVFAMVLCLCAGNVVAAERIVVVTHGSNTDAFWNVVKNGVNAAAKDMKVKVEYRNPPSGDLTEMARLIDAAVASKPDGLIVSIPDPDALGDSIKAAVKAGIPVVSINSGSDVRESLGCLFHVGQPEYEAGLGGGKLAKKAGVTKGLCINHEIQNAALEQRCQGYADGLGIPLNMLDVGADPTEVRNRVTAYLSAHPEIDGLLALGPTGADPTLAALEEMGKAGKIHFATFDLGDTIIKGIKDNQIAFAIDQQQYLQGYLPVVSLALYARYGLLPGGDILSGPGFVTKDNVAKVEKYAGKIR
jgi:simple sugar transport system substrate-binding protein